MSKRGLVKPVPEPFEIGKDGKVTSWDLVDPPKDSNDDFDEQKKINIKNRPLLRRKRQDDNDSQDNNDSEVPSHLKLKIKVGTYHSKI